MCPQQMNLSQNWKNTLCYGSCPSMKVTDASQEAGLVCPPTHSPMILPVIQNREGNGQRAAPLGENVSPVGYFIRVHF